MNISKPTNRISFLCLLAVILITSCQMNNSSENMKDYYNSVVREISSPEYCGRSLYQGGTFKTADYIIGQLREFGIGPCVYQAPHTNLPEVVGIFGPVGAVSEEVCSAIFPSEDEETEKYFQRFAFPFNTMRGDAVFRVDGKDWNPTVDYVFKEFSPTCECEGDVVFLEDDAYSAKRFVRTLNSRKYKGKFVVVDYDRWAEIFAIMGSDGYKQEPYKTAILPLKGPAGIIFEFAHRPGYFKARSSYQTAVPVVCVDKEFPRTASRAYVKVDAQITTYPGRNIIAQIPGTSKPEEFDVLVAHYDHLGAMGRSSIFYGANDNASGVAMLLSLARHYSQPSNRPSRSMVFIFFDAEEANLLGSWYYTANPVFPLSKIHLLLDFDMIGDTQPGAQCLHYQASASAAAYEAEFLRLCGANGWFSSLVKEDLCDDSDNYPFDLLGVPAMYFSIDGKYYPDYHTPRDTFNLDAADNFDSLFELATGFGGSPAVNIRSTSKK